MFILYHLSKKRGGHRPKFGQSYFLSWKPGFDTALIWAGGDMSRGDVRFSSWSLFDRFASSIMETVHCQQNPGNTVLLKESLVFLQEIVVCDWRPGDVTGRWPWRQLPAWGIWKPKPGCRTGGGHRYSNGRVTTLCPGVRMWERLFSTSCLLPWRHLLHCLAISPLQSKVIYWVIKSNWVHLF